MIVEMRGIVKVLGSLVANHCVDLRIGEGELRCLLGENGAGKTTLVSVLYGIYLPDGGEIVIDGEPIMLKSPHDAIAKGIGMIAQNFNLVPRLTVTENIVLGRIPRARVLRPLRDKKAAKERVVAMMEETGLHIDPDRVVDELAVGEQQRVEILKSLFLGAELLILDEPTAALSPEEAEDLLKLLRAMSENGKSIIIITHKLREAMKCDRVTVMRRGKVCLDTDVASLEGEEALRAAMFGEIGGLPERSRQSARRARAASWKSDSNVCDDLLIVENLYVDGATRASTLEGVSLCIPSGVIYGIAGVAGNGQVELFNALAGLIPTKRGRILLRGRDISRYSTKARREAGMCFVSEDRKGLGSLAELSVWENFVLGCEDSPPFCRRGVLQMNAIGRSLATAMEQFAVAAGGIEAKAQSLSGGNLQKLILARELTRSADVIIASQPTRGVDVKTADFVWELLRREAESGRSVLLFSYDLDEVLALSDFVGVMFEGKLKEFGSRGQLDVRDVAACMVRGWQIDGVRGAA
jgi:simple sugar transport system ATP-binding protein